MAAALSMGGRLLWGESESCTASSSVRQRLTSIQKDNHSDRQLLMQRLDAQTFRTSEKEKSSAQNEKKGGISM